ncbi:rhomboid family intramembrane serine protease [Rubricoccus marinus]|uniref:Peptidase S54 rhomboid domain-containing protein n=1 Tax=Rubricoccus marinus TaxID=716817 RepID=A0A259TZD5_9BACT|nr:rhomboid family intramembrane serine protease [Rubricoccus marinus]OZC03081.1 hypothetical protein BSZ36_08915 [Rubricoccus marinus]
MMPPVVKNLLILNVLAFAAQLVFRMRTGTMDTGIGPVEQWFALWPAGIPSETVLPTFGGLFWPWQIVTSAFLHGDFSHILFNMFGLWMFGAPLEQTLGSKRFAILFGGAVLGASLLQLGVISWPFLGDALPAGAYGPTLGASGGVLGVLGAFGMLYPNQPIYLLFLPVPIAAKWMVVGYAAMDILGGFGAYASNTAHFAHLGGLITGVLLILYWRGRLPVKPRARTL